MDPIFAAIEAHRNACLVYNQKVELNAVLMDDSPSKIAAETETSEAAATMFRLAHQLLKIAPTSVAGAAALLDYVGERDTDFWGDFPDDDEREHHVSFAGAVMTSVASALLDLTRT